MQQGCMHKTPLQRHVWPGMHYAGLTTVQYLGWHGSVHGSLLLLGMHASPR
jgi:hypothetical protein